MWNGWDSYQKQLAFNELAANKKTKQKLRAYIMGTLLVNKRARQEVDAPFWHLYTMTSWHGSDFFIIGPVDSHHKGPLIRSFVVFFVIRPTNWRKSVELPMIWNVMMLIWRRCNGAFYLQPPLVTPRRRRRRSGKRRKSRESSPASPKKMEFWVPRIRRDSSTSSLGSFTRSHQCSSQPLRLPDLNSVQGKNSSLLIGRTGGQNELYWRCTCLKRT